MVSPSRSSTPTLVSHDVVESKGDTPARMNEKERRDPMGDGENNAGGKLEQPGSEREQAQGSIPSKAEEQDPNCVGFDGADDPYHPENTSLVRKWLAVLAVSLSGACVTCASSCSSETFSGIQNSFQISQEVATLAISLFVAGLGLGPMFLAPLSEFYGRRPIYLWSFAWFLGLNVPVALANNAPVHLIFRFLSGFAGSAFLSVAGGTVTDMFSNKQVGVPMAIYSASPFLGPVLGPLFSGFVNQHLNWRWTYYIIMIWAGFQLVVLYFLVPETLVPRVLYIKAKHLRKSQANPNLYAPMEKSDKSILKTIAFSVKTPFEIIVTQPMAFLLNLWTSILLGILYLFFGAFPLVFEAVHGFNKQETGMSFLGIGLGEVLAVGLVTPYWTRLYRRAAEKHGGKAPPETRLLQGMAGAIFVPIGLFAFAFTTYRSIHWIVPILMSIIFGAGLVWVFTSVFTYLVDAYRPVAASAMASNSFMRSSFAAGFPLFGTYMYRSLGNAGATALLAGLTALMLPLPFVFYRIGPRLRAKSKFGSS